MRKKALFVDVDHTLIRGSTVILFLLFLIKKGFIRPILLIKFLITYINEIVLLRRKNPKEVKACIRMHVPWHNIKEKIEREYFNRMLLPRINKRVLSIIKDYKKRGYIVVLATATPCYFIKSLSRFVDSDAELCTRMLIEKDKLIITDYNYGVEKARNIRRFSEKEGIDLKRSSCITDSIEDLPMIKLVNEVFVVNPKGKLRKLVSKNALKKKWWII